MTLYYWTGVQLAVRIILYGISSLDRNMNLTIGTFLVNAIIVFEGVLRPFKSKFKNYQELIFMFNLQSLFIISLYNENRKHFVDGMVALTAAHFLIIVIHNFCYYVYGGVIRNKIATVITMLSRQITIIFNGSQNVQQQMELQENLLHNIPEVAFNYGQYREPLLGVD